MTGALGEGPEYSTNFQRQSRMQPSGWNILGLGAVGSLVAAQAVSRGYSIPAIVRHKHAHVTFNGASLELEQHLCANAPKISRLILATKAHQAKSALESVRDKLKDNAIILLMCNGMGILEELAPLVSDTCNFLLASNTHGVKWEAEGHLVHTGKGVIRIGSPFSTSLSLEDIVCDLEIQTGLNWIHDSNIMVNLFKKLAVNVCINSSTALINCRNGDLSKLGPYWNRLVETLCKEVCKVAKMKNVHLDLSATIQFVHEVAEKTAKNTSSMLADVNAQRLTEVDYINGYIARHGGRVNEAVQDLIHMREKMYTA